MRVLTETQDNIVVCGDTIIDLMVYDGFLLPGEAISIEFRGCFEGSCPFRDVSKTILSQ